MIKFNGMTALDQHKYGITNGFFNKKVATLWGDWPFGGTFSKTARPHYPKSLFKVVSQPCLNEAFEYLHLLISTSLTVENEEPSLFVFWEFEHLQVFYLKPQPSLRFVCDHSAQPCSAFTLLIADAQHGETHYEIPRRAKSVSDDVHFPQCFGTPPPPQHRRKSPGGLECSHVWSCGV
jgi:hypothetical protein